MKRFTKEELCKEIILHDGCGGIENVNCNQCPYLSGSHSECSFESLYPLSDYIVDDAHMELKRMKLAKLKEILS